MKPLINLKSFLAVLLILIVPAALLVAYFRNYSPEAGGHEHSEKGKGGAMKPGGDSSAAMGHGNMAMPSTAQSQPKQAQATQQPGAGAEPMQEGMNAMGRVKDLTGSGKGTELVSRLFHAGATDFFLDHAQHITLSTEQQTRLNQIKEQALLDKASANREVQEAEQQLWKSTASDQPDPAGIETKVREVEKLRADQRIGFIRAVDQAATVLTAEQRQVVLGGEKPAPQQNAQLYTCRMHPEIAQDKPGECPRCGMKLVPKKTDSGETKRSGESQQGKTHDH